MPYDRIEIGKMEFRGEAPDPNVWRIKYPVRGAEPFEFDFHGDHYTAQAPGLNDEDTPLWYVTGERKGRENKSKTEKGAGWHLLYENDKGETDMARITINDKLELLFGVATGAAGAVAVTGLVMGIRAIVRHKSSS